MSVLDYHLQHILQRIINRESEATRFQLRNVAKCGKKILHPGVGSVDAVYFLRREDGQASAFGHAHCRNPFVCPVCSAKIMEETRSKIASAIDMQNANGQFGFMATFTIPHLRFMSCRETTDILYETWKYFRSRIKSSHKNSTWAHPFKTFCDETGMQSWVRVCEYTYGDKNGWHPHFHCIFWVPNDKADIVLDYEKELCEFWIEQARRVTLKYWKANNLHSGEDLSKLLNNVFKRADWWGQAIKFSRDNNGKLLRAVSANYLAGWTSDKEATGNVRKQASHPNHYTPYQILEMAETDPKWAHKYIEFAMAVTTKPVHHRMNFSKDGIYKRMLDWQAEHGYITVSEQKKSTWQCVGYIDEESWFKVCLANRRVPAIANIMYLVGTGDIDAIVKYVQSLKATFRIRGDDKRYDKIARVVEEIYNT